jgi:hypothetical protein
MRRVLIPTFLTLFGFAVSGFAADAVSSCRSAVWSQVRSQYGSPPVALSINSDNQNYSRQDWVTGTFFLARDSDRDNPYQFTCSVNDRTGSIARLDIRPAGTGEANRSMDMGPAAVGSCQGAVNGRLRDRGYESVSINSIRMDPDGDRVVGSARAGRGYGSDVFDFSCHVDPRDGDVRSVDLNRR